MKRIIMLLLLAAQLVLSVCSLWAVFRPGPLRDLLFSSPAVLLMLLLVSFASRVYRKHCSSDEACAKIEEVSGPVGLGLTALVLIGTLALPR